MRMEIVFDVAELLALRGRAHKRQREREKERAHLLLSTFNRCAPADLLTALCQKKKKKPRPLLPKTSLNNNSDTPLLSRADLDARLRSLPAWSLSPDGTLLSREFRAKNFAAAVAFLSAAADVAEAAGHHPDFHLTEWNRVRVDATTHAAGGITLADASLAAKLDAVPVVYSPKWLREQAAAAATKEGEGGR